MKKQRNYHIYVYSNVCGLHTLEKEFEFVGSKTGAIRKAREAKKNLKDFGICKLPMSYDVYDFEAEEYVR